jgi:hypothetical protein
MSNGTAAAIEREIPAPAPADEARLRQDLERTWYVPRGVICWLSVVDHLNM